MPCKGADCFFVLYSYPGVRSLTGPYPPGYVPAGLSAPYALSGLVFVIAPWAYSVSSLSGRKKAVAKLFSTLTENHHKLYIFICIQMVFSLVPRGLENCFAYSAPAICNGAAAHLF